MTKKLNKFLFKAGEFSVIQFFHNDSHEYVRRRTNAKDAMNAFNHYIDNPAVRLGITVRVIIVDAMDEIVAEWKVGEGIILSFKETEH